MMHHSVYVLAWLQTSTLLTQFAVDQGVCSLYIITSCSNNQVMRTKEVITKEQMSWYLDKFSSLVS